MALSFTDLPLEELKVYRPDVVEPADFDEFWAETLREARVAAAAPVIEARNDLITELSVSDVTFSGFAGDRVKAWMVTPHGDGPFPAVIEFIGYGGGRGLIGERLAWAAAGFAYIVMDTRGQGSGWGTGGDTPDPHGSAPSSPGFMTQGIEEPSEYYYRRLFTDAARLVETVSSFDIVDASRIAVTGGSQGGGVSIAAAALVPEHVSAVMPDVPFLCHFERSVGVTPGAPFTEIVRYLSVHRNSNDRVFNTLSYIDGVNFSKRVRAAAYYSVALMDEIVLPSTVFAAYNALQVDDRQIEIYEFNGHEAGNFYQWQRQVSWLRERFAGTQAN